MKLVLILFTLLHSASLFAGPRVIGNGGGLWTCHDAQGEMQFGVLVDLYEASNEFELPVILGQYSDTPESVLKSRQKWLQENLPQIDSLLRPYLERVQKNIHFVDAKLRSIEDIYNRIEPGYDFCFTENIKYTQFANFTVDGRILISEQLWYSSKIAAINKAALIFHEAIYLMLRETKNETDSVNARYITGILFTTLNPTEMKKKLSHVMDLQQ
ncbi:hypothetical protein AZI86_10020 [Bdellovibrio bacteriovorus]|uniref:Secreted protein n=1 Tax=Bdellovibrio bacteriovorus TaxID=959 RepID=A0A150WSN2_BDEBC|nr:hypothetical protein [Bdellovibrio bacteriovorus]KYG67324.1 hypothetical protein AZI86_10020 [Bdellovibrio bacteriovorus]